MISARRAALLLICCLGLVSAASCSGDDGPKAAAPTTTSVKSSTATPSAAATVSVKEIARIKANNAVYIDLSGDRVSWLATETATSKRQDRVMSHDLRTGQTSVAATAGSSSGTIEWARLGGDHLVYVDRQQSESWRIVLKNLTSGKTTELDRDRSAAERSFNPSPAIDWPWVVWARPTAQAGKFDIVALDGETDKRQTVATTGPPQTLGVHGSTAYAFETAEETGRGDVVAIDLPSGALRKLTSTGAVYFAGRSTEPMVAYEEAITRIGARLLATPLEGGEPVVVRAKAENVGSNITAGDGFAVFYDVGGGGVAIAPLAPEAPAKVVLSNWAHVGARLAADGRRAAWGETKNQDPSTPDIVVVDVTVGR